MMQHIFESIGKILEWGSASDTSKEVIAEIAKFFGDLNIGLY